VPGTQPLELSDPSVELLLAALPASSLFAVELLAVVLPKVRDVRRMGAASLDLCAVATGRVDGYYEQGLQPWDLAAGGLVAEEAGVRVTGLHGRTAGESLVVAAREPLAGRLVALLESLDADRDPLA